MHQKLKRIIIIALLSVFVVAILWFITYVMAVQSFFHVDKTETLLTSSLSPSGAYTVELRHVGTPFLHGASTVSIWIRNADGEAKEVCQTSVGNDGAVLFEGTNYSVQWVEDGAVIKLDGNEQPEKIIHIKNEDFVF